nr:hypothetical protein [Tanacetum cinerariifolium]
MRPLYQSLILLRKLTRGVDRFGYRVEQYNGEFDESARSDGQFFFDDERIDTEYDVQSSEDACTDDNDDVEKDFLVDEENEIVEPDVDAHLFVISMDLSFDNIVVTNLHYKNTVGLCDVTRSGVDCSGLSHDESFDVDDLDLNLNEPVNLNISQVETQFELLVFEEPDVGRTHEPIFVEVSTQEPIVTEVSTQEHIMAEVSTELPIMEEVET